VLYRIPELERLPWLLHGFGTRHSAPPANLATLHQIHSAECIDACGRNGELGDGDALLSNSPGLVVGVKTADCIPILLVDEEHRAVAAVHAGWRGTEQQIAARAVDAMRRHFGTRPEQLHAAIGPGIGPCCFEVGPEVSARFGISGRVHLDLPEINRRQLLEAGVMHVYSLGLCTMCRPGDFHSFRRDRGQAGRMISFAGVHSIKYTSRREDVVGLTDTPDRLVDRPVGALPDGSMND
jgi:polyphenol oxidase